MHRVLAALLIACALLVAAGTGAAWYGMRAYNQPGPLAAARDVVVPHGTTEQAAASLQQAGVIQTPWAFRLAALLTRPQGRLHAAEFEFPAGASLRQVLAVLRSGKPVQHKLTIPEGLTAAQIVMLIERADALAGPCPVPPEGAVLPQTYEYERGTTRAAIVTRASLAMDRALNTAWAARAPGLPLDGPRAALILASIVEHETARPAERPHIAAVFLNRLRLGMMLQSDPTVIYGATGGLGGLDRKLTRADLDHDDPYNTYRHPGLPPGPIDSPGVAAIQAVMQPAASADLYFVANGTGGHAFAETLAEHERNVAHYRAMVAEAATAANANAAVTNMAAPQLPAPASGTSHPHARAHRR